jgi:UDP-3-O-[3-hydroxymyristoyl] N-acetylglucosamine deacetylase
MIKQKTLKKAVELVGVGIHSGQSVWMKINPAPVDTGLVFKCSENTIPALSQYVGDTRFCTTLIKQEARLSMVEHVLSAMAGLGIDNALIEVSASEVPIMDGSAYPLVEQIVTVGLEEQTAPKKFLKIKESIEVQDGNKWARVDPYDGFKVTFEGVFTHPAIPQSVQKYEIDLHNSHSYIEEVSKARTFGFLADLEFLRSKNLALGGSLENAVVLDDEKVLNPEGLRYANELMRHKVLDAIGDLCLLGYPVLGAFSGYSSGHTLNDVLVRKILAMPEAWEIVTKSPLSPESSHE